MDNKIIRYTRIIAGDRGTLSTFGSITGLNFTKMHLVHDL